MSGQSERLLLPEHSATSLDVVHCADTLAWLRGAPSDWLNCVVTSPPYLNLRDYGAPGQIGLEDTPDAYVARLVAVFREIRRVLRPDGTVWLNLGSSYCSHVIESQEMVLRDDLTLEERRYVLEELAKHAR